MDTTNLAIHSWQISREFAHWLDTSTNEIMQTQCISQTVHFFDARGRELGREHFHPRATIRRDSLHRILSPFR